VSPLADPNTNDFSQEFTCRECGSHDAHRSRPRNFFEKRLLPLLMLQSVRCDHCCRRFYVYASVEAQERRPPERQNQQEDDSSPGARIA